MIWLSAACPACGSDFRVRPASRAACPDCGSTDVATWRDDEDQLGLFEGERPMLQAGQTKMIEVNKPERDAIDQILRRLHSALDEFERNQLKSLLAKID